MPWRRASTDDPQEVPNPGFSRRSRPEANPLFDPSDSPLSPGGRRDAPAPTPADSALHALSDAPTDARRRRVMFRVRREGWVARREQARSRFASLDGQQSSSTSRLLGGLDRRGLLARSKSRAARARFDLRGRGR